MKEYKRKYPKFSLCGLNCGLCPRYNTVGKSRCPGCGGDKFHLKHPTCAIVECNRKKDNVEFCFQCSCYPCKRYTNTSEKDSFITYKNVISDFEKIKNLGIAIYTMELDRKVEILEFLINNYNDGRRKNFYCIGVNLLNICVLEDIKEEIDKTISKQDIDIKYKIERIIELFNVKAIKSNIRLELRK